jgi:hypothetical protein
LSLIPTCRAVELAIKRWGEPTERKHDEIRFGSNGGRHVTPSTNTWKDFESGEGGGYVDMYRAVYGDLPPRKTEGNGHGPDIKATYDYRNAAGDLVFQVVRTLSGSPRFWQHRPNGKGGWIKGTKEIPRADIPLYRLPELLATPDDEVFFCEGEKDADRLFDAGLTATTNVGGACSIRADGSFNKWLSHYAELLRGRHVIVLQDNDQAGIDHVTTVCRALHGVAASIKRLPLPGLKDGEDVSDWLDAGNTLNELQRLAREAPEYQLPGAVNSPDPNEISLADLETEVIEPLRWIVPDYIPEGLTVLAGKPKIGKSWLMLGVALGVARGTEALGKFVQQGDVLYCGLEDGKRRMQTRVRIILGPHVKGWPRNFSFRRSLAPIDQGGLDTLEQWCITHPNRRLIVIDVLGKVRGHKTRDEDPYQFDYRVVSALQQLAERYRIAIVLVHHVRKASAEDVLDEISGTTGIAGAADLALVLGRTKLGCRLAGRGRDTDDIDKLVELDPDTGIWSVVGEYDEAAPDSEMGSLRRLIGELLTDSPLPLTSPAIATRLDRSRSVVRKILSRMWKDGQAVKNPDGSFTSPKRQTEAHH